jgi:putative DNA primase/helicase
MPDDDNVIPINAVPKPSWLERLQRSKAGFPLPTLANALIIMANDPKFDGMLAHNTFTDRRMLMRPAPPPQDGDFEMPGPYPRPWRDEDVSLIQAYMQRVWADKFHRSTIADAIQVASMEHRFHPITDWLDTLVWDGHKRIDNWLINVFDVETESEYEKEKKAKILYHQMVGSRFLIAAVRRVRRPGCKFDSMLILEGPQRIGKSTAVLTLFGQQWFSDSVPPDLKNRDAAIALHGLWCLEFAEIEHLVRMEIETIKAFLSRAVDHYRPVHGRDFVDVPRQAVLVGTTNSDDYLRDPTGNSRMWPVRCRSADIAWLTINRDQLWAEACSREASGQEIWLDDVSAQTEAASATAARMSDEVWEPAILKWLTNPETNMAEPITAARVLELALGMSKDKMTKAASMRVGSVLRANGWVRHVTKTEGVSMRVWRMPDEVVAGSVEQETDSDEVVTGEIEF